MKRSATAIALSLSLAFLPSPAKPNPAATLAIPACASFLPGCVVLGTIAIAGGVYWVYENSKGLWIAPIIDPENPEGWEPTTEAPVYANSQRIADRKCREMASRYGKRFKRVRESKDSTGGVYYVCEFYSN